MSVALPVPSTNKTDRHNITDITEILLKVALNTLTLTFKSKLHNYLHA